MSEASCFIEKQGFRCEVSGAGGQMPRCHLKPRMKRISLRPEARI